MAKKKVSSESSTAPRIVLAVSELHLRLEGLEKEHQSLLKQIKRKRTELEKFISQMRSLATEMFHKTAPIFEKREVIDEEIHTLFNEIFTTRKLGKKSKKQIESLYQTLQFAGIISDQIDEDDEDIELDEMFENSEEEEFWREQQQQWGQDQEIQSPSAKRSDSSRKVRQIFLKLAEIFHPDMVTDSETQRRHTEIMKEVNKAYQEGDMARLLEIEKQYNAGESIDNNNQDDLTRKCNRIEEQNQILKSQHENLKRELRLVKQTPEGALVSDHRKAVKQGVDLITQMVSEMESQIEIIAEIRNFVKDFRHEKITIKDFLEGPKVLRTLNKETIDDLIERMFEDFEDMY